MPSSRLVDRAFAEKEYLSQEPVGYFAALEIVSSIKPSDVDFVVPSQTGKVCVRRQIGEVCHSKAPNLPCLPFHCHRHRIPSAKAESSDSAVHVAADHFVNERHQNACTARADRMANCDRAAVYVYFRGIE